MTQKNSPRGKSATSRTNSGGREAGGSEQPPSNIDLVAETKNLHKAVKADISATPRVTRPRSGQPRLH